MTGALLGMLVELAHLEPVFAEPSERPEDALNRLVPLLVVVAGGEGETFTSDLFIARAHHPGVGGIGFGVGHRGRREPPEWARHPGLPYLELPTAAEPTGRA